MWGTPELVFLAELLAGYSCLTEGDSAVVGGDFELGEDFEAFVAQGLEAACKQKRVLEAATA